MVLTQFGTKIKSIRFDNALEFNMHDLYNSNGIIHTQSCVYTPQQNSVMERKHWHILVTTRALQIQFNVPLSFGGDYAFTAIYLINRLPSPLLNNKIPYELLFNKTPSYSHLRTFGCLCYATNINPHKHKFYPRARKSLFLGYPYNVKGYKLFDLESHFVFISRDVVFHETIFPYSKGTTIESTNLKISIHYIYFKISRTLVSLHNFLYCLSICSTLISLYCQNCVLQKESNSLFGFFFFFG